MNCLNRITARFLSSFKHDYHIEQETAVFLLKGVTVVPHHSIILEVQELLPLYSLFNFPS